MLNQRGGHVLFGVMRERDVVDQQVSERTIEEISTEFLRIEPSVFPMVERVRVKGVNEVIVITDTIPVNRKRQAVGKQLPELNYCISPPVAFPLRIAGGRLLLLGDFPEVAERGKYLVRPY